MVLAEVPGDDVYHGDVTFIWSICYFRVCRNVAIVEYGLAWGCQIAMSWKFFIDGLVAILRGDAWAMKFQKMHLFRVDFKVEKRAKMYMDKGILDCHMSNGE